MALLVLPLELGWGGRRNGVGDQESEALAPTLGQISLSHSHTHRWSPLLHSAGLPEMAP